MKVLYVLSVLTTIFYITNAEEGSCPETCDIPKCTPAYACSSSSYVKDACGCCDVCVRVEGESCGGRNERLGRCEAELTCVDISTEAFSIADNDEEEKAEKIGVCEGAQDCVVSAWSSWSKCSVQCGFGTMKRIRLVVQAPKNGGKPCPSKIEKKGCFRHRCEGNMILAQILPAKYRRLDFGSYEFEKILPDKKTLTAVEKTRIRFRSHCVKFKLMSKHPYCKDTTWASKLKMSKLMCVECQPAIMDNQGFCKGEGIVGNFTSWMATGSRECSGLWMRVGEKIPDCKCDDNDNQNFIFV